MGEKALRPISALSGGEKARVALALFMLIPHNVLVLDEPSNHLDVATVEVLTQALAEFKGTLIVVSHNQPFVEALRPTHIGQVRGKTMLIEERMLRPSDWAMDGEEASQPSKATPTKGSSGKAAAAPADDGKPKMSYAAQRALFKKISAAPKRIAKIEQLIAETEKKVSEYEAGMYQAGSDVTKVRGQAGHGHLPTSALGRQYIVELVNESNGGVCCAGDGAE
jgi:ATP-binding cassette subfamily F protein 3